MLKVTGSQRNANQNNKNFLLIKLLTFKNTNNTWC